MKKNIIAQPVDTILAINYTLAQVYSAKELANELKGVLKKNKIDYAKFNTDNDGDCDDKKPPAEIYEYQNFFVLQRTNGDIVLLDGFRRLLWYNAPNTPIFVRFYNEEDLTSQQILTLLVNLNHFKFFGGSAYHERGFSLLLRTVFDIDITKIKDPFDAYLSKTETKSSYSDWNRLTGQDKNEAIKNRIINKFFVSDIKFLAKLKAEGYLCDKFMGALLYELRCKSEKEFDVDKFISLIKENKVLVEQLEKHKTIGTNNSAKSQDVVNKIIEMYRNIFTLMEGGKVEQSFAEKQKECKELVAKLKKDKNLTKMTGATYPTRIESEIEKRLQDKQEVKFICVVHPVEVIKSHWDNDKSIKRVKLSHGLLDGVKFLKYSKKHLGGTEMNFGAVIDGVECRFEHNHSGYYGYGKKYVKLMMPMGQANPAVDLFVCIPQSEIPK